MEVSKVFLFAVFEIIFVFYTQVVKCTQDMDNWKVHQKRISKFPCSLPQPRAIRFEDIVDKNELPDIEAEVFPKMTVLHRCDSQSGCCKSSTKVCAPQVTEDVSLTFRIIRNVHVHRRAAADGARDKFFHVVATNHTFCSCQSAFDLPK